LLVTFSYFNMS